MGTPFGVDVASAPRDYLADDASRNVMKPGAWFVGWVNTSLARRFS
jgi:hypothetical protein